MSRRSSQPLQNISSQSEGIKSWVFLIERSLLNVDKTGNGTPDIVKLRHPRSGLCALFLFSSDNLKVQEIISISDKRSWFINDSVVEDGKMNFSTPVDPLFLILPYLKKSKEKGKVMPLEDLLVDDAFPESYRLAKALKNVHLIADRKGSEDLNAWMYNEDKTMKWLSKKVDSVIKVLKEKRIDVRGGACSANFIKVAKNENPELDKELYLKYTLDLVSEYLTDDLRSKLQSHLGLPEESPEKKTQNKRKLHSIESENYKKVKNEEEDGEEEVVSLPKKEKPKTVTAKEKAMMRAASNTKSITSFFKKK